ncbi:dynamin family protein [Desulfovibrio inopinatus]|uniref:dynamin family protein n=1 Tax=Desulfovibrio inopinatus TaxID=102109 RepID=UPI0004191E4B|nr:dynamin family protein [Desulfovibrio inopinatus]
MTNELLHQHFLERRSILSGLVSELIDLTSETDRADLKETAIGLLANLNEPFLFVVVGEVKTGKSSFVNALLGSDICPVAPDPCTDRIQMIMYGVQESENEISPHLKHIYMPNEILRDIAIVDTPGIDSIIEHHQEITERFIPRSDLVLFVFSAINPYSKSAWDFLELVSDEWKRKLLFVLNQADLASEKQIEVNTTQVRQQAIKRNIKEPKLFLTAAALEKNDPEHSGIKDVRAYIRDMITGGRHHARKIESVAESAMHVLQAIVVGLKDQFGALEQDRKEVESIKKRLKSAQKSSRREVEALIARVSGAYVRLSGRLLDDFESELGFHRMVSRSMSGLFKRKNSPESFITEINTRFEEDLSREVEAITRQGADHVSEALVEALRMLIEELRSSRNRTSGRIDLAAVGKQREHVIEEVISRLRTFLTQDDISTRFHPSDISKMDPKAAMGGVLVLLGTVFAVSIQSAVVDITGGVVAASGMLMAGSALVWNRPRLVRKVRTRLSEEGVRLEEELRERLASQIDFIFRDLKSRFTPFYQNVEERGEKLVALQGAEENLSQRLRDAMRTFHETSNEKL